MLAQSPGKPLPESIINRPKTGFSVPMAEWLSEASGLPLLTAPGVPWARRWAKALVTAMAECDGQPVHRQLV